jgi:hypothetical protein
VEQRVPDVGAAFHSLLGSEGPRSFSAELEAIAGSALDDLSDEHKMVIREVVNDRQPKRRWLTLAELATVEEIRKARPEFPDRGLDSIDLNGIVGFLEDTAG